MNPINWNAINLSNNSRRGFIKQAGAVAATASLVHGSMRAVHAAGNETLQVALIGCGGRGTGAASNALSVPEEQIKLVAMADVFPSKLSASYQGLSQSFADKVDVPEERKVIGFDGYKKVMDMLNPGDVVVLTESLLPGHIAEPAGCRGRVDDIGK